MAGNSANVDFGNRILNTLNGIKLPLLPVSILSVIQVLFWLVLNSNLVKITDFTLSKLKYLIFTASQFLCPHV